MTQYVVNISQYNLSIPGLKMEIPLQGWAKITEQGVKHEEVQEAVRRGWIKIELVEPGTAEPAKPNIEFSEPAIMGSKTIPKKTKKEAA